MLNVGRLSRPLFPVIHLKVSSLSSACQLFDGMPKRRDFFSETISTQYTDPTLNARQTDETSVGQASFSCNQSKNYSTLSLSSPNLLEISSLSRTEFIRVLILCIRENGVLTGKQFHCLVKKCGLSSNPFIGSSLISMYSRCGLVKEACSLFDEMTVRDLVLWNVMISCYSQNQLVIEAFRYFSSMRLEGLNGDDFTFSSLLSACSSLGCSSSSLGKQVHSLVIRLSLNLDVVVCSSIINMYAKCGQIEDARRIFDVMKHRNIISWNTLIGGYGHNGDGKKAMILLKQMVRGGLKPDELTFASVLSSCADSAMNIEATQVHNSIVKHGFQSFSSIGNALIIAYAKNGCISNFLQCFHSLSNPDLFSWTSMITAYAFHGLANEAIDVFEKMKLQGVKPEKIAFLCVLSACSHGGLVEKGLYYFYSMKNEHQIEPSSEHYTCLVDLLGRSGYLNEAHNIILSMPFEPSANILGAFIGACKLHNHTELAKWAADSLFRMEPSESANYKVMSNVYGGLGYWDDVAEVRKTMKSKCGNRVPGCSWIESGGRVHTFASRDESHPQAVEMYDMLVVVFRVMKDEGGFRGSEFNF